MSPLARVLLTVLLAGSVGSALALLDASVPVTVAFGVLIGCASLLVTGPGSHQGMSGSRLVDMPAEMLQRKRHVLQDDLHQLEAALELQRSVFEASADLVGCVDESDARRRFLTCMRAYWFCQSGDLFIWERGSWRCVGADATGPEPVLTAAVLLPEADHTDLVLDLSPGVEGQAALILRHAKPQPHLGARSTADQRYVAEVLRGLLALSLRRVILYQRLQSLGRLDPLTTAFRRWYGEQRLQELIDTDSVVSVAMLDIDHFKTVNDELGHAAGDQVLAAVGSCLRGCLRTGDICARFGGEEFLVLLPATSGSTAVRVADRLRQTVAALSATPRSVTVSIGVASCHIDETVPSLLQRADVALYEAKHSGRNRVCQSQADREDDARIRTVTKRLQRPSPDKDSRP